MGGSLRLHSLLTFLDGWPDPARSRDDEQQEHDFHQNAFDAPACARNHELITGKDHVALLDDFRVGLSELLRGDVVLRGDGGEPLALLHGVGLLGPASDPSLSSRKGRVRGGRGGNAAPSWHAARQARRPGQRHSHARARQDAHNAVLSRFASLPRALSPLSGLLARSLARLAPRDASLVLDHGPATGRVRTAAGKTGSSLTSLNTQKKSS
mmetsp:Transcript_11580/g.29914  ORF Transcript_11580/g.29914 Transcript_11580/m.29914 type:complete len:211 (-) Transcript_11580:344-976(-)